MLASSSRNVLRTANHNITRSAAEVNVCLNATPGRQRYASNAAATATRGPSRPYKDPRNLGIFGDAKFRAMTNSPTANYNLQLIKRLEKHPPSFVFNKAREMKLQNVRPDRITYNVLLAAAAREELYMEARAIYEDMIQMDVRPDHETFHHLLESCSGADLGELFNVLQLMETWSIRPSAVTYEILIVRLTRSERLELALQYLSKLSPAGLEPTLRTAAAVIRCAAKLGFSRLALDLADAFESTSVRRLDSEVWVDVLTSCASDLYLDGTRRAWYKVVNHFKILPDEGCCLLVMHTAARYGQSGLALEVVETLKKIGIVWHEHHIAPVVEAMCFRKELKEAFIMFEFMRKNEVTPTLFTAQPILEQIQKDTDQVDEAWTILESINEEGHAVDVVAMNVVLQAALALNDLQRMIGVYKAAANLNVKPDVDTYNLLLKGCVGARHRELGDRLLMEMKEARLKPDRETYERMIQLCLGQTTYEDAFFYLEEMKSLKMVPPVGVYEDIIRKLVSVGDTRWQLALEEMKECGYEVSTKLQSFISSGGAHNGPDKATPTPRVVL